MVGIVDYGMGNLLSVYNAIEMCGSKMKIIQVPEELPMVDKIILPGVGAFFDCMKNLHERGFVSELNEQVLNKKNQY